MMKCKFVTVHWYNKDTGNNADVWFDLDSIAYFYKEYDTGNVLLRLKRNYGFTHDGFVFTLTKFEDFMKQLELAGVLYDGEDG